MFLKYIPNNSKFKLSCPQYKLGENAEILKYLGQGIN